MIEIIRHVKVRGCHLNIFPYIPISFITFDLVMKGQSKIDRVGIIKSFPQTRKECQCKHEILEMEHSLDVSLSGWLYQAWGSDLRSLSPVVVMSCLLTVSPTGWWLMQSVLWMESDRFLLTISESEATETGINYVNKIPIYSENQLKRMRKNLVFEKKDHIVIAAN